MKTNTRPIARTHFEEKGVEMQECSLSMKEAEQEFERSCMLCTLYKRNADCDTCPIKEALMANVEWFGAPIKDYPWIVSEKGTALV